MGRLTDIFAGKSVTAYVARGRQRLAAGEYEEAARIIEHGLKRFPGAQSLREVQLLVRRATARAGMQNLKMRSVRDKDPEAFEKLIALYREVEMPEEARRTAADYVAAYSDRAEPHLLLGEMHMDAFFEHLQARDGHKALKNLSKAAHLDTSAYRARLLLAELYFCVAARRSLAGTLQALDRFAEESEDVQMVLDAMADVADANAAERADGLFERIEVDGCLPHDPGEWPLRTARNRETELEEALAQKAVLRVLKKHSAEEIVVLRSNGTLLAHGTPEGGLISEAPDAEDEDQDGLVRVARSVARTVTQQAREFDLGAFRRCSIQGPFGQIVVGRTGNTIASAHHRLALEPLRLWERLALALEGAGKEA